MRHSAHPELTLATTATISLIAASLAILSTMVLPLAATLQSPVSSGPAALTVPPGPGPSPELLQAPSGLSPAASSCPNLNFYGNTTQLDLQQTVDCAGNAGFSGNLEITFVSMAYQESNFCPGAIESGSGACAAIGPGSGPQAEGILQEGTSGQSPPQGGPFPVTGYSPSSCSTWSGSSTDWGGIYFNPTCSFQWALAYYNYNNYQFWGSYLSGAYCNWAPNGFLGTGSVTCSGTNQNQANLPWSTVCPNNNCSASNPLTTSYSMYDKTTSSNLTCTGSFAAGDVIQFTATASGGAAPYNYTWSFGDGGVGYGATTQHIYITSGTVDPILNVTDSAGKTGSSGQGCTFTVTGTGTVPPTISSFTASANPVQVNQSTDINVTATGGSPPYTYVYTGLPPGCASSNSSKLVCTPTSSGNYTAKVTVTDTKGLNGTGSLLLTVLPSTSAGLAITAFSLVPSTITLGNSISLTLTATGGSLPYSYAYTGLPGGCTTQDLASFACTPTSTGNFSVLATVTDAASTTRTATAPLTVNQATSQAPSITSFTASVNPVPVNSSTTFTLVVSGGTLPYTYQWSGLPKGCTTANAASLACVPSQSGLFAILGTVTDAAGKTASSTLTLNVTSSSTGGPVITAFAASPASLNLGNTTVLRVTVSGGTLPLAYLYAGLPPGCSTSNVSFLSCSPSKGGNFTIYVTVTDSHGKTTSASTPLAVKGGSLGPLAISSFQASPAGVPAGSPTTISAAVTGGSAPYSYAYSGLPAGCTTANVAALSCTPSATGTFTVHLVVTDARGATAQSSTTLTVTSASNSPGPLGLSTGSWTLVLVGVAAVALIIAAVALRRHRTRPGNEIQ